MAPDDNRDRDTQDDTQAQSGPGQPNFTDPSAPLHGTGSSAAPAGSVTGTGTPGDRAEQKAREIQAQRKTVIDGLTVAHDNHVKELDALIAHQASGEPVTSTQLQALKAGAVGIHKTLQGLASGAVATSDRS